MIKVYIFYNKNRHFNYITLKLYECLNFKNNLRISCKSYVIIQINLFEEFVTQIKIWISPPLPKNIDILESIFCFLDKFFQIIKNLSQIS